MATKSSTVRILPPCGGREMLGRQPQDLCYGGPEFDDQGGTELHAHYQATTSSTARSTCSRSSTRRCSSPSTTTPSIGARRVLSTRRSGCGGPASTFGG